MEFTDGKIIRSKLFALNDVSWASVLERVGLEAFVGYMDEADLISFNNWTMLPHMTALWNGILAEAVPAMRTRDKREKILFFDLADPEKRTKEDLLEALGRIKAFRDCGFHTILGLNKKEACEIAEALGSKILNFRDHPLEELVRFLYGALSVDCLVVHPVDCAACVVDDFYFQADGPYCANPKLTTARETISTRGSSSAICRT
jgi:hypothetical protein